MSLPGGAGERIVVVIIQQVGHDLAGVTEGLIENAVGGVAGDGEGVVDAGVAENKQAAIGLELDIRNVVEAVFEVGDDGSVLSEGRIEGAVWE